MCHRRTKSMTTMILVWAFLGSLAPGQTAEMAPLKTTADLDLSGDILYAVNFGNNGSLTIGGVVFSEDEEHAAITLDVMGEGPSTWWGPYPGTGDAGLDQLLDGVAYRYGTAPNIISIDVAGLAVGESYLLQLIGYEPENHDRDIDIMVDDEEIVTGMSPIIEQGGVVGQGGSVVRYEFLADDPILSIRMISHRNACALSGLILSKTAEIGIAFADCGSGTTIELAVGKGIWQTNWGQGPWTWSEETSEALLDPNVTGLLDLRTTAPADVSQDMLATLPIAGTLTLTAHGERDDNEVLGTMILSGTGINVIDINPARVIVDEASGMFMAPFHPPAPKLTLTLEKSTGVFAYIDEMQDCELHLAGSYAVPLIEGLGLSDNILTALSGGVPLIGGIGAFRLAGEYVPDPDKTVQSFCEYGTGVALQIGAGGALWDQVWSSETWDWYECAASANAQFLGDGVVGQLETTTAGAPQIDANMVLSFDFGGEMTLSAISPSNPDEVIGRIVGDVDGTFVADLNADHATFDDDGNIVVAFGWGTHDDPDAKIMVTEATGIYSDIKQAGLWRWYVNGTLTAARLPDVPLQQNILAGLEDNTLLLGAEEKFVLTGLYYRDSQ